MKRLNFILAFAAFALLFSAAESFAQKGPGAMWRGSGGWGPGASYSKMYDPKKVETISGEVTGVSTITPGKGMSAGIHMNVKTDKETISVHLGPSWYLENQDVKIEAKDKVEVKGSRITFDGKPAIIAAEVKKGDEVLKLRDDGGFPVWAGWRRR
ncbi:MAG TPA: DNA-binding protein [Candidatus Binatia bacterium]|nr:DNA-binding protein [Candidatus Binatia bacterium]